MADVEDRVIFKLHRVVVPHSGQGENALSNSRWFWLTHWTNSPRAIARANTGYVKGLAVNGDGSCPISSLRESLRVKDHTALRAEILAGLLDCLDVPREGEVHRHWILAGFEPNSKFVEWCNNLNREWSNRDV